MAGPFGLRAMYNSTMNRRTALKSLSAAALAAWRVQGATPSHRLIAADKGVVAIIDAKGAVEWVWKNGVGTHDVAMLPNGNVMALTGRAEVSEVNPQKE